MALTVVAAGSGMIVARSVESVQEVPRVREPGIRAAVEASFYHFRCLERQLNHRLRRDARLFIVADDFESYQRLVEIATPHVRLVASRASATHLASFARTDTEPACDGWKVVVRSR